MSTHDDSVSEGVTPFLVHRVSAAHSYRSLTPLNMDVSDSSHVVSGHNNNNNNNNRLLSHGESTDEDVESGQKCENVAKNSQNYDETYPNTSNETSLEMIKISLTSSSDSTEVKAGHTDIKSSHTEVTELGVTTLTGNDSDVSTANQNSLSDRTLGPELPSLPTDGSCEDNSEPVSLSHIQLQDMSATES